MRLKLARLTIGALVVAAFVVAFVVAFLPCPGTAAAAGAVGRASSPASADVVEGRFVAAVGLDGGMFKVTPAPRRDRPTVTESAAAQKIWASPVILGRQEGPLGYGIVTISLHQAGVPRVSKLPAWVGFARSSGVASCPDEAVRPGSVPTRNRAASLPSSGYAAIVIGAGRGAPAVSYVARSSICDSVAPASTAVATEVLSVPWVAIGGIEGGSMPVRVTMPPCGSLEGISSSGSARATTITIGAAVPDAPSRCAPSSTINESVYLGPPNNPPGAPPPVVTSSTTLVHAPLGPADLAVVPPAK